MESTALKDTGNESLGDAGPKSASSADNAETPLIDKTKNNAIDDAAFRKMLFASMVGNILEWYDFAVFGYFAKEIGGQFFPTDEESQEILDSFAVFGAAFLMRPLGGVIMGKIGDRVGRKRALEISIALMLFPSFLMGFIPTYSQIGLAAPIILVLIRLTQGVATGGELVGAFIYLIEASPENKRGFWGAVCFSSAIMGTALGAGVGALVRELLEDDEINTIFGNGKAIDVIGWRIPFWASAILGVIGVWLRRGLHDSNEFQDMKDSGHGSKNPICDTMTTYWKEVVLVIGHVAMWTTVFYIVFVWLGAFNESLLDEGENDIENPFVITFGVQMLCATLFPLVGYVSDKVGLKTVMMTGTILLAASSVPLFILLTKGDTDNSLIGQVIFSTILSLVGAPLPAYLVERFPVDVRYTGMGISYNIGQAIFGGSAGVIATELSRFSVWDAYPDVTPGLYISAVAIFSLIIQILGIIYDRSKKSGYENLDG
eukprot:m.191893 g.191893  ORF g.191893 m.191893 type:complete len:487 (+) comp15650_c0_seq6:86-1546(+)